MELDTIMIISLCVTICLFSSSVFSTGDNPEDTWQCLELVLIATPGVVLLASSGQEQGILPNIQ